MEMKPKFNININSIFIIYLFIFLISLNFFLNSSDFTLINHFVQKLKKLHGHVTQNYILIENPIGFFSQLWL